MLVVNINSQSIVFIRNFEIKNVFGELLLRKKSAALSMNSKNCKKL